jgi:hypothetical protein
MTPTHSINSVRNLESLRLKRNTLHQNGRVCVLLMFFCGIILSDPIANSGLIYAQSNWKLTPIRVWSGQDSGLKPLRNPSGICSGTDGTIYVADTGNNRVMVFDSTGRWVKEIGGLGLGSYQFNRPSDVTAKSGLDILVADTGNDRIQRFNLRLGYISTIANSQLFTEPTALDMSSFGDIFILDGNRIQVVKINALANRIVEFGGTGSGSGELSDPRDLSVQGNETVWVADGVSGNAIQFDIFGNYLQRRNMGEGIEVRGITVRDNLVWIAAGDRIGCFNDQIPITWFLQSEELKQLQLSSIDKICLNQGSLVILDSTSGKIAWFRILPSME